LLVSYSGIDIYKTVKWLSDQTTKAIHRSTDHTGPVWCKGSWISFIFDEKYWSSVKQYIERHNERRASVARDLEVHVKPRPWVAGFLPLEASKTATNGRGFTKRE
jgi:hypothetical protein